MNYKVFIDTKNSDRFDVLFHSEQDAKAAVARIKGAIEAKHTTVEVADTENFVVDEIIAFSYAVEDLGFYKEFWKK